MKSTEPRYIMAFDAGTTSCRAVLFDRAVRIAGIAQQEFPQIYPKPGWVEHDPMEIWASQSAVARQVLEKNRVRPEEVAAIGITNQRETAVVWDRKTGAPICNAIVWQDRRTAGACDRLRDEGAQETIRRRTGLVIDSYFSATKLAWILDEVPGVRERAGRGELAFGTVDTWIVWNLTRGAEHVTDQSNASRTMLYNIHTRDWDDELLELLRVPRSMLPRVAESSGVLGRTDRGSFGGACIPIAGIAGDQQAALFGQTCFDPGQGKNTYGTGCFILMNTGDEPIESTEGLLTTIAWSCGGRTSYALEGSVFVAGAAVQWLRDELAVIRDARDSEYFARKVPDTGGVYLVPAFTGLGAPYWDMYARGTIVGMTRGTTMNHLIRATLESIAYQVRDVARLMSEESGIELRALRVDGGASANDFLMQFQSDVLGVPVDRPRVIESTATGAAFLAGLAVGFWPDLDALRATLDIEKTFSPAMPAEDRETLYAGWRRAVERSRGWLEA